MKREKLIVAFQLISRIKMNVVTDKETRSAIISNHLLMYKVAENHDNEVKEAYKKLFEGKEEEAQKVNELRQEYNAAGTTGERKLEIVKELTTTYRHILDLENEINQIVGQMLNQEVDLNIAKLDKEMFVNACADSGIEFTMADILRIEDIFKSEDVKESKE